jgi:hypothetical protein
MLLSSMDGPNRWHPARKAIRDRPEDILLVAMSMDDVRLPDLDKAPQPKDDSARIHSCFVEDFDVNTERPQLLGQRAPIQDNRPNDGPWSATKPRNQRIRLHLRAGP